MSHAVQMEFVDIFARSMPNFFTNCRVLEVGSLDVNGSVRTFFRDCAYLGIDVGQGPGVDLVCQGQDYAGPDGGVDTVISCECMEHNPYWRETFRNMVRSCRVGGLVLMTCASVGRPEHGTPGSGDGASPLTDDLGWDYYRNLSKREFGAAFPLDRWFAEYHFWTNWAARDLYFGGVKCGSGLTTGHALPPALVTDVERWLRPINATRYARRQRVMLPLLGERGIVVDRMLSRVRRLTRAKPAG